MSDSGKPQDALDRWRAETANEKGGGKDDPGEDQDQDQEKGEGKRRFYQTVWFKTAIVIIVIGLIAGGIILWANARQFEDTDDAFIDTRIVQLAPQIAG